MNILLVQEDKNTLSYIKKGLVESGYMVDAVSELTDALELFYTNNYNLIISDTLVDGINGLHFLNKVRKTDKKIGFIFLTSDDDIDNKIKCFEAGVDDYITKPFNFREFVSRVKAILKREKNTLDITHILKIKNIEVDLLKREVKKEGKLVELTLKEFLLFEFLLENKNLILSRTILKEKIWGIDFLSGTNIVDVYINKIRNKLSDERGELIKTVRGFGYSIKDER